VGGSGGAPGSLSGCGGGSQGGSMGLFGSCLWLIKSVLLAKDANKITDNQKIKEARKAFEIIGEPGEVEAMAQQTYDSQPDLNLYWNSDSPFPEPPALPDDEDIEQVEEGVEDKQADGFVKRVGVGVAPPQERVDCYSEDG
jgi:hypothetical protein